MARRHAPGGLGVCFGGLSADIGPSVIGIRIGGTIVPQKKCVGSPPASRVMASHLDCFRVVRFIRRATELSTDQVKVPITLPLKMFRGIRWTQNRSKKHQAPKAYLADP